MLVYLAVVAVFFLLYFLIPRKQAWIPFTFLVLGLAVLAFLQCRMRMMISADISEL